MKKFATQQINDKIVNQYLFYRNLDINRRYSSSKKIIKKIDHYQWWFQKQKQRKSFFILKQKKPIFISTSDHFKFKNYQFMLINHPYKYFNKLMYSFHYLTGKGINLHTQYNFNVGIMSEPFDRLKFNTFLDYRIKYLDPKESDNDLFFRVQMEYDIQ